MSGGEIRDNVIPLHSEMGIAPNEPDIHVLPNELAKQATPYIIDTLSELGLDDRFLPITARHIADLRLGESKIPASTLMIKGVKELDDKRKEWHRLAVLSSTDIKAYRDAIDEVFTSLQRSDDLIEVVKPSTSLYGDDIEVVTKRDLSYAVATEWLFYELVGDAVANSFYMQQKWVRYMAGFDGQNVHYQTELSIAENFFKVYGDRSQVSQNYLRLEHASFRRGLALVLLGDSLLRNGLIPHSKVAEWLMQGLAEAYPNTHKDSIPVRPLDRMEVMERLVALKPKEDVEEYYFELGEAVRRSQEDE